MPWSWFQNLQDKLNINKQLIHKFACLLYILTGIDHVLDIPHVSQDRQLSGLRPLSGSILASNLTRDVHNKIYSLNKGTKLGMME